MNSKEHNKMTDGNEEIIPLACDKTRILVVDDQPSIRNVFKLLISSEMPGYQVDLAENGAQAVEFFQKDHECLLLMDLHMPVMDGETAFHEIEQICHQENREMPSVLFCTGYQPPHGLNEVLGINSIHSILIKPISGEKLINEIKKHIAA